MPIYVGGLQVDGAAAVSTALTTHAALTAAAAVSGHTKAQTSTITLATDQTLSGVNSNVATDIAGMTTTITTTGGDLVVDGRLTFLLGTADKAVLLYGLIDNVVVGVGSTTQSSNAVQGSVSFKSRTALAAGSHTIKLQWRTTNGSQTITCNASTTPLAYACVLDVQERFS